MVGEVNMSKEERNNMFMKWISRLEKDKSAPLEFQIKDSMDILELYNFFLVCQKEHQQYPKRKYMNLNITCSLEDEFRIKHYLYLARYYVNIRKITVNKKKLGKINQVNFYKIFPLILIDRNIFHILSNKVSTIEKDYQCDNLITMKENNEISKPNIKNLIIKICIHNLVCEIEGEGIKHLYSKKRIEYFQSENFHRIIHDLPILALFIFSIYNRTKGCDAIKDWKEQERLETGKKSIHMHLEDINEIFPAEDEIIADIFNAWDISDGLLQLIENIVFYAGKEKSQGEGILSLRIHRNSKLPDNKFDEDSELYQRYKQYFRGYRNEYVIDKETNQEILEMDLLNKYRKNLMDYISKGQYVEGVVIERYEYIRKLIEQRRLWRREPEYFLEIQLADCSGKNMMDVFLKNLKDRNDPNYNKLKDLPVSSFFNPNKSEKRAFEEYYKGDNIIKHYGLQIFASVILNNEGGFEVKSQGNNGKFESYSNTTKDNNDRLLLSGTQYDILLPLTIQEKINNVNTLMNADINYKFLELTQLEEDEKSQEIIDDYYKVLNQMREKENCIEELVEILGKISNRERVLVFDCDKIKNSNEFEVFCKSLLFIFVQEENRNKFLNVAIKNCEEYHFVNMIRFFTIYYDKNGKNNWLRNQIYLCGKDSMEEFLISGQDIQVMLARMEKLAFSRRMSPRCMRILTQMLERRNAQGELRINQDKEFSFTPFDLLIKNQEGETIFEQNVLKVLDRNIQKIESGCKIHPTHMRIGSKIHIDTFYEAELLFYNDYYVNRFAYLVLEKLVEEQIDFCKPICMVGYEIYSEMLICRVQNYILERFNAECSYIILGTEMDYFNDNSIKKLNDKNMQTILIVPVNSTLTTFNKLEAQIKQALKKQMKSEDELNVRAYIGIIQVIDYTDKDCLQAKYWDAHKVDEKVIYSKKLLSGNCNKASYIISTESEWKSPITCSNCYPADCLFEIPLVETDKTSVVPTQLIGLKEKINDDIPRDDQKVSGVGKIKSLDGFFYYDHVQRGANHYQIYIRTAHYFAKYEVQIKDWLEHMVAPDIRKKKTGILSFDILVHALHFSNAAFVEAVNEKVFNGASYTIRIEAGKEFKDNVETKFSDLKALYINLKRTNTKAELNFHFIDDNINLGNTIYRTKHLISAMFTEKTLQGEEVVKVNVFRSVIVILNRLSTASIRNYVKENKDYYYYIDLKISSMRTHEDACYLCKEVKNAETLYASTATNALGDFWKSEKEKVKLKSLIEAKAYKEEINDKGKEYYNRYYRRIYCAHTLNEALSEMGGEKNEPLKVLEKFVELVKKKRKNQMIEYLMSYLCVFSEPFISYRKSNRESAFVLLLFFIEMLVMDESSEKLEKRIETEKSGFIEEAFKVCNPLLSDLQSYRNEGVVSDDQYYDLFKLLLKLLTGLKSNYILREDRIVPILVFNQKYQKANSQDFKLYYLSLIKRVISLYEDESKSTHFEMVLHRAKLALLEEAQKYPDEKIYTEVEEFWDALYLENTIGIYSAVKDLAQLDEVSKDNLEKYYFDNYREIMCMNFAKQNLVKISQKLSTLYQSIREAHTSHEVPKNTESIKFYEELAQKLVELLEAEQIQFVVKYPTKQLTINEAKQVVYEEYDDYRVFAGAGNGKNRAVYKIFNNKEIADASSTLILDTVYRENKRALVKYIATEQKGFDTPVFILIEFLNDKKEEIIKYIRFLLMFRNDIMRCLATDFDNNIIQEWIEKNNTMLQLVKARASTHTVENDAFRKGNLWDLAEGFFYGKQSVVEAHWKENEDKLAGCVLGLMNNIRIGRANVMLLSGGTFQDEYLRNHSEFDIFKDDFKALGQIYFKNDFRICDRNGDEISENDILPSEIFKHKLVKNQKGKYCKIRDYILYFVFEIIHSAVVYGRKDEGKVNIRVYDEEEYLYFENPVAEKFCIETVLSGLRREGNGISLATICEFFIENYNNRFVSLEIGETFKIGLPIFKK